MSREMNVFVLGVVILGCATIANASFLTGDGGFAGQRLNHGTFGDGPTAPWSFGSGTWVGDTDETSPFTNVFSGNSIGVGCNGGAGKYLTQTSATNTPANASGYLSLNVDFKNVTDDTGSYGVFVSKGQAYAERTLGLYIGSSTVYAESGTGLGASLLDPVANTWYNVQLTLNLNNDTYSGLITAYGGGTTLISSRSFVQNKDIDTIFTDTQSGYPGGDASPSHRIDNFVLSSVPEPSAVALLVTGFVALLAYAWRKRR